MTLNYIIVFLIILKLIVNYIKYSTRQCNKSTDITNSKEEVEKKEEDSDQEGEVDELVITKSERADDNNTTANYLSILGTLSSL